jgi:hypothetical protein
MTPHECDRSPASGVKADPVLTTDYRRSAKLSDRLLDGLPERGLVSQVEQAELANDEAPFNGGEHRLDSRGFEEPGRLPLADPDLAQGGRRAELAGYRHHHAIRPPPVVRSGY